MNKKKKNSTTMDTGTHAQKGNDVNFNQVRKVGPRTRSSPKTQKSS